MAGERVAYRKQSGRSFRGDGSTQSSWTVIRLGHGLDAPGYLCRRNRLNLTPCVYPLIPITVSYFGGRSGHRPGSACFAWIFYIGGLSLTNSILGVIAALTGGLMGAMLQNPIVLIIVAAILVFFATSLLGFWELRLA